MEATSGGTATGRSAVLVGGTMHAEAGADWTLAASARDSGTWWPAAWQAQGCACRCSTFVDQQTVQSDLGSQRSLPHSTDRLSCAICTNYRVLSC